MSIHHLVVIDAWGETLSSGWAELLAQLKSADDGRSTVAVIGVGEAVVTILATTPLSAAPPTLPMPPLHGEGPADTSSQLLTAVLDAQIHLEHPEVVIHLYTDPRLDDQRLTELRVHPSIAAIKRTDEFGRKEDITAHQKLLAERRRVRRPDAPTSAAIGHSNAQDYQGGQGSSGNIQPQPIRKLPPRPVEPPPPPPPRRQDLQRARPDGPRPGTKRFKAIAAIALLSIGGFVGHKLFFRIPLEAHTPGAPVGAFRQAPTRTRFGSWSKFGPMISIIAISRDCNL